MNKANAQKKPFGDDEKRAEPKIRLITLSIFIMVIIIVITINYSKYLLTLL